MNILLLEDDLILSAELCRFLESNNFNCDKIYDGETFLRQIKNSTYDLYLLDINVPKINGLDVCQTIRSFDKNTPIIIISAYGDISDKKDAFTRLADDYLVKPFQFEELLLRINSLLRRKAPSDNSDQDILRIDDLIINKTEQKVYRGGNEITLTLKEFQLLVYLAEAQGRTVSKQQITEHVWEHNFNTNTNTVEVYINFLRKKIDKDFKIKLIHTRSGFGYYLSPL
ncbi:MULTISPECIES: response regulator transcription factor [Chryseobacterium]|jgi:DNA-binding response OmpR family regulator|uniref:DNA-binding response OmpR family regulator n=4 Tax=Chryseobacterium TaxID=59732 RepID=A0A543ENX7_9FLAO|nr:MULTISPECIES: response regulator transcription factor [Chryseobacterium]KYH04470.1 DNA-binding response regulator [Chryseobacterium cucumeris]MBO9692233.1 response regulator transcription factor [Chryseobacterium sp.]MDH5035446.1 response regulator transcription factor [Chryseobacterium cucumeris]MDR6369680.1 DNA-binding response OmpR family regulator [Chryseobacterium vietnamense]MDR6439398.1 DNA-binding response OmpR family regulator [Chryseobacterium bernardetii]